MSIESECQVARSWVDVGSFHMRLVVRFMIFTASVRSILDTPSYSLLLVTEGRTADEQFKFPSHHFRHIFGSATPVGQRILNGKVPWSHSDPPHSVRLLWTRDRAIVETSTWQRTTFTTDKHPCPRRDSNPNSQHPSGRRPKPRGRWYLYTSGMVKVIGT
jgi:hypothetical protein